MKTGDGVFRRQRQLPRRSPESGRTTAAASVSAGAAAPGVAGDSEEHGEGRRGAAVAVVASAAVDGDEGGGYGVRRQ